MVRLTGNPKGHQVGERGGEGACVQRIGVGICPINSMKKSRKANSEGEGGGATKGACFLTGESVKCSLTLYNTTAGTEKG